MGFADYLLQRSSRVAAIGAGGALVDEADNDYTGNPLSQFAAEKIPRKAVMIVFGIC